MRAESGDRRREQTSCSTTLAGYTDTQPTPAGPNLGLVAALARRVDVPVFAEGRVHTPEQAAAAIEHGAFAVVVGTAITHPTSITRWFADAVRRSSGPDPVARTS